jgi:hypothetical protein
MNRYVLMMSVLFAGVLAHGAELPFLRPTTDYSGVRVVDTPQGQVRQHIYRTADKIRTVTEIEGMRMTNIVRQDLGLMWLENPMMGGCLEQRIEGVVDNLTDLDPVETHGAGDVEYRKLGEERIGQHDTSKYEVIAGDAETGTQTVLFWVTEDNIMMRMEVSGGDGAPAEGLTVELEELSIGPQPDELFEKPGECIPMPAMPGMPGMPAMPAVPPGKR